MINYKDRVMGLGWWHMILCEAHDGTLILMINHIK